MNRRFAGLLSVLAFLFAPNSGVLGQAAPKVWRLGVLSLIDDRTVVVTALAEIAARGFVEGRNLIVDMRVGTAEHIAELSRELINTRPDVIMALSDWAVLAAHEETRSIPIVAAPIGAGTQSPSALPQAGRARAATLRGSR